MTQHSHLDIARLLQDEQGNAPKSLPPIHLWQPPFCGEIDMCIKANGEWLYQGTPIKRHTLVKLFSSILRKEDDGAFYLVTPVEKVRITVEDAPLVAVLVDRVIEDGVAYLKLTTATDDVVIVDENHPLWVIETQQQPRPYIRVRDSLDALVGRNVFYQLVNWAELHHIEGKLCYAVQSAGQWFKISEAT